MKRSLGIVFLIACLLDIGSGVSGCFTVDNSGDGDGSSETTHQYLVIPGAQFFSGSPSGTLSAGAVKPTVTAPANTTYTVGTTVTWTLDWSLVVDFEVTDIIIDVPEIDGYFDYMLSDEEITNQTTDIDTYVTWDRPETTQVCNRDYRGNGTCYEQADTGVTGMNFTTANVAEDAVDLVDLEIDFMVEFTAEVVTISEMSEDDGGDGDGGGGSGNTTCSDWVAMCSCSVRACSDGTNSWYDVGSGVYYCASLSNCTSAATNAANYCTQGC